MSPLNNIEFIVLFDDITFLGKVTSVIHKVSSDIMVTKYFDVQQLLTHDLTNTSRCYKHYI